MACLGQCLVRIVSFQETFGGFSSSNVTQRKAVIVNFTSPKCKNGGGRTSESPARTGTAGHLYCRLICRISARSSSASSAENAHEPGEQSSRSLETGESGNSVRVSNGFASSVFAEYVERERDRSRDSIEGLTIGEDEERERDQSRDSIEGLATDWNESSSDISRDLERERDNSRDSIEGLATDARDKKDVGKGETRENNEVSVENNSEWKNVFPAYMQSRENEVEKDNEECSDEAVAKDYTRKVRNAGATEAAAAAVASAKEFDSQFGPHLLSSASPVTVSPRFADQPTESGKLKDLISQDPIWAAIRAEARLEVEREPLLSSFLYASILAHSCFERSLGFVLANRLKNATLLATQLLDIFDDVFLHDEYVRQAIRLDVQAVKDRDPSCRSYSLALLYLKGYHALQAYRIAHALWNRGQKVLALALQSRISEVLAVDIHPAACIGKAILLDHGTGLVIGETAVVGDRVSMLHGVTLGGTGKAAGDRHPKIREGVLIGAGATILGNIVVGKGAMVAAGSLVLKNVPPHSMVAGTPAKVVGFLEESVPSLTMKQDAAKNYCHDIQRQPLETRLDGGAGI